MKTNKVYLYLLIIISSIYFNCGSIFYPFRPWPNGEILYTFSTKFSIEEIFFIESCMAEWEKNTTIDFKLYNGSTKGLYILHILKNKNPESLTSSSTVGYCSNPQIIFGLLKKPIVLHELGHAIGLSHEHQRPDRDKYIKIDYKNIDPDFYFCFKKLSDEDFLYNYKKFAYDYFSIMHYYDISFSKNGKPVFITPYSTGNTEISAMDASKVNEIYRKSIKK